MISYSLCSLFTHNIYILLDNLDSMRHKKEKITINQKDIRKAFQETGLIPNSLKEVFKRQHYAVVGNNGAVEICRWTKESLKDHGFCYKQQFYGIRSHLCCQMTPAVAWCDHSCVFCWRATQYNLDKSMEKAKIDDPKELIDNAIKAQRMLLTGFKGNPEVNQKKFEEAQEPMHFAISLTGEPTLYPRLPELIRELHARGKTSFLVTNGQHPEMIERLLKEDSLPTQVYLSLDACDEEMYASVNRPLNPDGWQRLMRSLDLLKEIRGKTRTVIRYTAIKGLNMVYPEKFAELILRGNPMFLEVKAYMWVGHSRDRLSIENMPRHEEVRAFAEELAKALNWQIIDEKKESRVVLVMEHDLPERIMHFD